MDNEAYTAEKLPYKNNHKLIVHFMLFSLPVLAIHRVPHSRLHSCLHSRFHSRFHSYYCSEPFPLHGPSQESTARIRRWSV